MQRRHSSFILRFALLAMLIAGSAQDLPQQCSVAVQHFADYTCREEPPFGEGEGESWRTFAVLKEGAPYTLKVQMADDDASRLKANTDLAYLKLFQGERYIAQLIDSKLVDGQLFEILTSGAKGNLGSFFKNNPDLFADRQFKLTMFRKILLGVQAMHRKKVIHADLKLENIVIDANDDPSIINFEVSVVADYKEFWQGTLLYMDPLVVDNWNTRKTIYNQFRDVYSLGVILFYLDQGNFPFPAKDRSELLLMHMIFSIVFHQGADKDLVTIVDGCLKYNERKRKTLDELIAMTEKALANPNPEAFTKPAFLNIEYDKVHAVRPQNLSIFELSETMEFFLGIVLPLLVIVSVVVIWFVIKKRSESSAGQPANAIAATTQPLQNEQLA